MTPGAVDAAAAGTRAPRAEVRLVHDPAEAADLVAEWDELAEACGTGPLSRPRYALGWWRTLGRGRLLLATARVDGRLVVLAPLHERRAWPVRRVRWLGHGLGTVAEMLVLPGHEDTARAVWVAVSTPARVLDLLEARGGAVGVEALTGLSLPGRRSRVHDHDRCPVAELTGDGLDHVRAPGNRNLRKMLRRADRRLDEDGRVFRVTTALDLAGFEAQLPSIRAVFDSSEAHRPRQHLLEPPYSAFVLDYLRGCFAAGEAVAVVGHIDDEPVSFQVGLLTGRPGEGSSGLVSLWIARFAPTFAHYSPGHLTQRATFCWAAARGWPRIDLLLGESQNKSQWSTGWYPTLELRSGTPAALAVDAALTRVVAVGRRLAPGARAGR